MLINGFSTIYNHDLDNVKIFILREEEAYYYQDIRKCSEVLSKSISTDSQNRRNIIFSERLKFPFESTEQFFADLIFANFTKQLQGTLNLVSKKEQKSSNPPLTMTEPYYKLLMQFLPRPRTTPQQLQSSQNVNNQLTKNHFGQNSSITSMTHLQKQHEQQLATKKSIRETKRRITTRLQLQSLREIQFQKDLNQNKYTINLSEFQKHPSLPKISSISNIRQNLVSEETFQHYKRVNAVNGNYQQALKQLQRVEEQKIYKLKFQNKMKIKTRKNIFQMRKTDNISDIYDLFILNNKKMAKQSQKEMDPLVKNIDKIVKPLKRKCKTSSKLDCKWKLGDFLDPIICDQNQDYGRAENVKNRLSFLTKIQKITNACNDIEDQNATKNYLNLFSKFSEKLSSNLHKKTRKLDKVRTVFRD